MKKHPYLQYLFLIVLSTLFISCKETTNYQYIVNLPQHFQGAPVVFMLHGYGSSAENFKADTHFEQEANARGSVKRIMLFQKSVMALLYKVHRR